MTQAKTDNDQNPQILKRFLEKKKYKSIFLVTGKHSYEKSGAKKKYGSVLKDYKYKRFYGFDKNPKVEDVSKGVKLFNKNAYDVIIAIGGGSVIDMAKLISYCNCNIGDIRNLIISKSSSCKTIPIIAIPSTSGTGSEVTNFAVVYVNNKKYSVVCSSIMPVKSILDPELTYSMSPYLTAVTGLDAFSQSIESFWSINSTEESRSYSMEAIKMIWGNLGLAVTENSTKAKKIMCKASNIAGKAINITKTTAPHALSYGFSTFFDLPHGHAVSLFLPYFVNYHSNVNIDNSVDPRGTKWVMDIVANLSECLEDKPETLASSIKKFINNCGITIDFAELNISKSMFDKACDMLSLERLGNNPLRVDREVINDIYYSKYNNS